MKYETFNRSTKCYTEVQDRIREKDIEETRTLSKMGKEKCKTQVTQCESKKFQQMHYLFINFLQPTEDFGHLRKYPPLR